MQASLIIAVWQLVSPYQEIPTTGTQASIDQFAGTCRGMRSGPHLKPDVKDKTKVNCDSVVLNNYGESRRQVCI